MSFDIHLSKIECFGKHGIYDDEKKNEQKFFIDIYINIDDFAEDDISKTINYEEVVDLVIETVANESFDLIESLSKNIVKKIVSQFQEENLNINEINDLIFATGFITLFVFAISAFVSISTTFILTFLFHITYSQQRDYDKYDKATEIETAADDIIDFSEGNPFGTF